MYRAPFLVCAIACAHLYCRIWIARNSAWGECDEVSAAGDLVMQALGIALLSWVAAVVSWIALHVLQLFQARAPKPDVLGAVYLLILSAAVLPPMFVPRDWLMYQCA
jgi:hypothetical protein